LFFGQRRQQFSFCAVMPDAMSCDHEGQGSVQVLMDDASTKRPSQRVV
jgi:hypothetical protein